MSCKGGGGSGFQATEGIRRHQKASGGHRASGGVQALWDNGAQETASQTARQAGLLAEKAGRRQAPLSLAALAIPPHEMEGQSGLVLTSHLHVAASPQPAQLPGDR